MQMQSQTEPNRAAHVYGPIETPNHWNNCILTFVQPCWPPDRHPHNLVYCSCKHCVQLFHIVLLLNVCLPVFLSWLVQMELGLESWKSWNDYQCNMLHSYTHTHIDTQTRVHTLTNTHYHTQTPLAFLLYEGEELMEGDFRRVGGRRGSSLHF